MTFVGMSMKLFTLKKSICLGPIFLFITISSSGQPKKVLFLGNSYTAAHNMPQLIAEAAKSTGDQIDVETNAMGGAKLKTHAEASIDYIKNQKWDFVVLQAQSQEPSFPLHQVQSETFPYAKKLCNEIRKNHACTKPLFFMTWGRKNGDAQNCQFWPPVCTYAGMDSMLRLRYQMMADSNKAALSPVSVVWRYLRKNYPDIELYDPDGSHPSENGSYAAACAFYTMILGKNPENISFLFSLDLQKAKKIQKTVRLLVYDSLEKWNAKRFRPKAQFTYIQQGSKIIFSNNSPNLDTLLHSWQWNFGDNNHDSSNLNPIHTYQANTDTFFKVQLIVKSCEQNDTFSHLVNFKKLAIKDFIDQKICVYPNPSYNKIYVERGSAKKSKFVLFSKSGKRITTGLIKAVSSSIDISFLPAGLYFLRIDHQIFKIQKE